MPILALDSMGNLYETDPDSSEGTGCKCAVPKSGGGDIALGSPYQDSENRRLRNEAKLKTSLALQDHLDSKAARMERRAKKLMREAQDRRNFMAANPFNQLRLERKGLRQSIAGSYEDTVSISGTGLSANGLPGEAGRMNTDQLSTQAVLTGSAPAPQVPAKPSFWSRFFKPQARPSEQAQAARASVFKVSDTERLQYEMNRRIQALNEQKARLDAKRVAQEARDLAYNPSRDEDMVLYAEQRIATDLPKQMVVKRNPLLRLTRGY